MGQLLAPAQVTGALDLKNGLLDLNGNTFTFGLNAAVTRSSSAPAAAALANGEVRKEINAPGSFTFPLGDGSYYTPATLNFTSLTGGGYAGVQMTPHTYPGNTGMTNYLSRYWTVSAGGGLSGFSCTTSFTYAPSDVNGSEAAIMGGKWDGGAFTPLGYVNPDTHTFGGVVTGFSDFTSGPAESTAALAAAASRMRFSSARLCAYDTAKPIDSKTPAQTIFTMAASVSVFAAQYVPAATGNPTATIKRPSAT